MSGMTAPTLHALFGVGFVRSFLNCGFYFFIIICILIKFTCAETCAFYIYYTYNI